MIVIGPDSGATSTTAPRANPGFNLIVVKQMSLLCEISYLFNSKVPRQGV